MPRALANLISYLSHPGLMPTILFAIVLFMGKSIFPAESKYKLALLGFIFNFTFVLPALLIFSLFKRGQLGNLTIENRQERILPFGIITICYTGLVFLFQLKFASLFLITEIMAGIAMTQAICTIITAKFKISVHSIGIGGVIGVLLALQLNLGELDLFLPIIASIIMAGLIMSARLTLNAHTMKQVSSGFLLGFVLNFCLIVWVA